MGTSDDKFPWRKKATPKLLALEPRMLFDGAAVDATLSLNKEQGAQVVTDAAVTDPVDASSTVQLKIVGDTSALNADSTQTLSLALAQTQQQLLDFANSDRFYSTLEKIYNPTGVDPEGFSLRVEQLRANILVGGLNISVELRSATELAGYLAAYAAVGEDGAEKIYLDKDWVNFGLDQQMVSRALLEEIGHAIDQRLNGKNDTAGDEGEYFSRVVNQDALTTEDVQQLTTEDDHGVALIDGRSIEVEHASITFTKAYQGMNSTYTAVDTTSYGIQSTPIYIGTAINATAYTFQSANPADVQFSGNNVAGQLTYYSGGSKYVYNGVISRPDKTGNTPMALYFAETKVLGGATPTGRAFLLVMPGYESTYTTNQSVSTSSDSGSSALNSVLTSETSNRPPVISSNGGGDNALINFAENTSIGTAVTTVTSTDLDAGDTKSFSIYGGADAALFQINSSTGVLSFKSSPDYENPLDADRNNLYDVRVMVADSKGATDTQTLTVTVTNVNDNTPVITSNGGGDAASISVPQSTTSVTKVVSTDADVGDVVGYSISGGANSALFSIDGSTGQLSFLNAPVYNAGGNNTYYVTVQARDIAGHTDTQALTVTVTNVDNVAPTLAISSDKSLLGAGKTATITFTFSEPVQGFTLSDVTVAGGTLTNLVQDPSYPTIYRASFTQSGSSAAPSFSVASGSYQDTSSNNGAAASLTLNYDVVAPTVTVDIAGTDIAFGQTKTVTFTFSEDPSGTFTIGDISPTNGIVTNLLQSSTDSKVFTASIQSTSSTGGPVVVAVAGSYTDAAGNLGSGGQDSATLASPSIDLANTSASDTGSSSVDNITTNQKPVIVGNAPLSETAVTVTVTFGATTLTYNNVAVSNGTWSLDLSSVTPSTGTMPAGGMTEGYVGLTVALTSSSSVTASSSFLIDLTPPSTPTVTAQTATTSTPTIVGTTASDTDVLKVTVNGVTYTSDDGYLSYVKGSTTWSLVIPAVNALSSATYPVTAVAYDLAGKSATDATTNELTVNLNTAAPILDLAPSDALTLNNTATYTQGGTSVAFAKSGVNISDADSTNLASFTVGYASSSVETGDRFELGSTIIYLASGASSGTVYFNGTYFSYAFTTVGGNAYLQFTSRDVTNSSNAVAATASYEALLDALKFSNDAATFTNNSTRIFSVTANDGSQSSGAATFSITMVAANHAPVLDAAQSPVLSSVSEDSGVPTGATGTLVSSLVGGVSDADTGALKGIAITVINTTNGALYYSTDGGASWAAVGAVSSTSALLLAADGNTRLYYVPSANYNGTVSDALTFSAWDRTSGVAGTKVSTASSGGTSAFSTVTDTVAISVTAVNDAPVASGSATLSDILEDASSPSGATVSSLFAGNFSDSTDSVSGGSSANTLSGIAITSYTADAAKGNWQYTTNGTTWTTIGTVSDTSALTLGVGANDKLRFVPTSNWNGAAPTLSVRLIDSSTTVTTGATVNVSVNGGTTAYSSGTVALSTSVTAVNDAPVAVNDTLSATEDTVVTYTAAQLLSNDTDVDNTNAQLSIASVTSGTGGTAVLNSNGTVTFTPNSNFNGVADFTYTVTDGSLTSNTATVTVNVTAVNDAPVAVNDTLSATEDTVVTYTAAQLLSNDTDVDNTNAQLSIASVTSGTGGTAVLNANGTVTFTPNSNFNGVADFTYTVTDGSLTSNTATVTVNVTAVNDPPIASDASFSAIKNTVYNGSLPTATDVEGDSVSYASVSGPVHGTLLIDSTGNYSYTPATNYVGSDSFTYVVSDGHGGSNTYTVSVTTVESNHAPVNTVPGTQTVDEDTALLFTGAKTISVSDSDGNLATTKLTVTNGALTVDVSGGAAISTGANGTTTLTLSGTQTQINLALATLSYQGNLNYNGSDTLTVLSSDNAGVPLTDSDTVTITVTGTNDVPTFSTGAGNDAGGVTEDATNPNLSTTGTLTVTDADGVVQSAIDPAVTPVASAGALGSLSINAAGAWTYTVANSAVQYLDAQETKTEVFTVKSVDGTSHDIMITITGANDAPVVTAITETKTENDASHVLNLLAGASDADSSDTLSVTNYSASATDGASSPNVVTIPSGALSLSGKDLTVDPTKFNYLAAGEQVVITVSYDVSDGTTTTANTATITITGANDAATFTGIDSASVTEDSNSYVKTGTLTVSDVDSPTSIVAQTNVDGAYGRFSIDSDGHWTYETDNAKLQPLNTLAEMTDTFTVTTADDTVHEIVVTLNGVVDVLSVSSSTVVEGTPLVFDVALSATTQTEQQFLFRYTGGTAVPGADFTNSPVFTPVGTGRISFDAQTGVVSVSSGVSGFRASFETQDDLSPEPDHTVDIQVEDIPSTGYISDGADMALTVENMTVNEASPYVVFRLSGVEGQQVQLSLVNFSGSDVPMGSSPAMIGLDTGTQIQYFDGYGWRDYAAGNQVTYPVGSTTLLVRVSLINDNVYEGPEAFKLVAVGSSILGGGNSVVATGLGTIGDNGRGPIYNQSGAEVADAVKDDDRLLRVSSITVNEGSEYAVFSVSLRGTGSRAVSLELIEGTGSGFANIDQGQVIQYWNGAAWHDYVANATVTIPDASALLVKVAIAQESDLVYEGPETFNLNVVGAAATEYGVATIIDDGTGVIYTGAVVGGVPVITKLGLDDDLDKDGIPPNVEEILATLSSSSGFGGNPGDLNGDGVPDAEQPAVATLAWISADYFNSALSGDLAEVRPIISMSVVSPDAQQRADAFYQLESISVVHQNDARFNGMDPAVSDVPGQTISTSWDPIVFSVASVSGSGASLVDIDGARAGTQIMVTIDISRSGLAEGAFNAYLKYVSQDVIAAAGGTLTDLDGQPIQKAGWYDFMQRQDANGNYHGDGARFVVKNGKIMAVQLTFTDNAFGDSNMAANMITDPGMPVHVTVEPVQSFVPAAVPKFLNLDTNTEAKEKEKDKLELDQEVPRVEVKGEWATKAQFTKASLNNALLKAVEPEPSATSKAQTTDQKSANGDKNSGLRNTLTPPDAVAGADGRLVYQLPQGTFTGGQGPVHLEATLKDGSPLPSWVSFDRATGRVVGHMPGGMVNPIEIKVQARDSKGNKAETVFKLKTRPDQVGFVGKQSLTAQLDNAMRWRA